VQTPDLLNAEDAAVLLKGSRDVLDSCEREWNTLCGESAVDTPFTRPEWISSYVRCFEPEARVHLAIARGSTGLDAVLPLLYKRTTFCGFRVQMLRGAGNEHSCRFDLLCAGGQRGRAAIRALWLSLRAERDWDVIELPYVPEGGNAEHLLEVAREDGYLTGRYESYTSPHFKLPESGRLEDLMSARFRRNLSRRKRKAQEIGDVRLRRFETAEPEPLERFFELEASGWKGRENTAIASSGTTRSFYNTAAHAAAARGYFSLYLLEFGDRVAAGHFGLSYNGIYYSPKVAYSEEFAQYGPGHLIMESILRDLQQRDIASFDFLGPWMDWKVEWAREGRMHSFCYIFRPGLFGQTLYTAKIRLMDRMRHCTPLRRALRAISGKH
jgi:CelD/BcsL family acetyltransferase involved in cellulose biosynthesis